MTISNSQLTLSLESYALLTFGVVHRCLQEISYLTSPQAMNPLPNRPLLNNPSIPLSLPNIPSFDQLPYNSRPRKVLPEGGKEFPLLNGINSLPGPPSGPGTPGSQIPLLERNNSSSAGNQPLSNQNSYNSTQQFSGAPATPNEKEKELESDGRQITAIYRPDDAGEWKEKLRQSHEASEQARLAKEGQTGGVHAWDPRRDDEDDDELKDPEMEIEDEDSSVVEGGDDVKVWKPKRTLRKLVIFINHTKIYITKNIQPQSSRCCQSSSVPP